MLLTACGAKPRVELQTRDASGEGAGSRRGCAGRRRAGALDIGICARTLEFCGMHACSAAQAVGLLKLLSVKLAAAAWLRLFGPMLAELVDVLPPSEVDGHVLLHLCDLFVTCLSLFPTECRPSTSCQGVAPLLPVCLRRPLCGAHLECVFGLSPTGRAAADLGGLRQDHAGPA